MKNWWFDKLRQRKASSMAFILDFAQKDLWSSDVKQLSEFYVQVTTLFNIPASYHIAKVTPHDGPAVKLIIPEERDRSDILGRIPEVDPDEIKITLEITYKDEETLRQNLIKKLEYYQAKIQPLLDISKFIAQKIKENQQGNISICARNVNYCLNSFYAKPEGESRIIGKSIPFYLDNSKIKASIELTVSGGNKDEFNVKVSKEEVIFIKSFLNLLEGLNPLRFRLCKICQKVFYAVNVRTVYCSNACKQKAYRLRKKKQEG